MTTQRMLAATIVLVPAIAIGLVTLGTWNFPAEPQPTPESIPQSVQSLSPQKQLIMKGAFRWTTEFVFDAGEGTAAWRQFRGNRSTGVSDLDNPPKIWSESQNILWDCQLPGRGASSPIAAGGHLYVTSSSGYGTSYQDPGNVSRLVHHVACLDIESGAVKWQKDIQGSPLTQPLNHQLLQHGLASSTPVTDGRKLFAFFGASGVFAFGDNGKLLWHADVGFETSKFGSAASPILYRNLVIVNASSESNSVIALDKETGQGVWRIDDVKDSWSTPVIGSNDRGEAELIVTDDGRVRGFDPATGKQLWECEGPTGYAAATPFVDQGVAYVTGGLTRSMLAIRLGGEGDVTTSHKLWEVQNASRHTSPIFLTGHLYVLSDSGVFKVFDAQDGSLINAQRIPGRGRVLSSPVLVGNYFYVPTSSNRVFIVRANDRLEVIRDNVLDTDQELLSCLCPTRDSLLIRTGNLLQCIGNTREPTVTTKLDASNPAMQFPVRYDYDPATQGPREYLRYIQRDAKHRFQALVDSLDTSPSREDQQEASRWFQQSVFANKFDQLLVRHRVAYWQALCDDRVNQSQLAMRLAEIEKDTAIVVQEAQSALKTRLTASQTDGIAAR